MVKRIARVFCRKTQYTPEDDLVFFKRPDFFVPDVDEVHISCLFSWDRPKAERLAKLWEPIAPVKIGGPAYPCGNIDQFEPGMYVKHGYTFTSRGCPNKCPFCLVPKQEGGLKELPVIRPGNIVLDNNLLACSDDHVNRVFDMLDEQKDVKLNGGLDLRLLKPWHAERISNFSLQAVAIAFDHWSLEDQLRNGLKLLHEVGVSYGKVHCFVLCGFYPNDTPEKAEQRCRLVLKLGAIPNALVYRDPYDPNDSKPKEWRKMAVRWAWQKGIFAMAKREGLEIYKGK